MPPPRPARFLGEARPPAPLPAHQGLDAARSALHQFTEGAYPRAPPLLMTGETVEDVCQKAVEMATACRRGPREKRDPPAKLLGGCCRVLEKALHHAMPAKLR